MTNIGIAPPEYTEAVGRLRALLGDTTYEELDPPVPGKGTYELFSDDVLNSFLSLSEESVVGAAYYATLQLANKAAKDSRMVKDFDLQVDLTKKSADYARLANTFKAQWDGEAQDIFELEMPSQGCHCVGEASPIPVCRGCRG